MYIGSVGKFAVHLLAKSMTFYICARGQNYIIVKLRYNENNNVNNIYDHEDL